MNGGEIILNRIKSDSDENIKAIELEAEKANAEVMAEAEKKAKTREKEIAEKNIKKLAQVKASSKSRAELEIRNALLKQRRIEIDKTVDALLDHLNNLSDDEYFEAIYKLAAQLSGKSGEIMLNSRDLQRLPSDFENRLKNSGLDTAVSEHPADIFGGFILKSGNIEENMDFSALINARRDEIEDLINSQLFAQ